MIFVVYALTDIFIDQFKHNEISGQINFMRSGTDGVFIWRDIASEEFILIDMVTKRLVHTGFNYKINEWYRDQLIYKADYDMDIIDLNREESDE